MNTYKTEMEELAGELVKYKIAYRRNDLPIETARYIAREIRALEQMKGGKSEWQQQQ
jgi:hypothetical protein